MGLCSDGADIADPEAHPLKERHSVNAVCYEGERVKGDY